MMTLLQCPWCSMSPSRNQTPGAISFTVFGWASPRVRNRLTAARTPKTLARRKRFIGRPLLVNHLNSLSAAMLGELKDGHPDRVAEDYDAADLHHEPESIANFDDREDGKYHVQQSCKKSGDAGDLDAGRCFAA